MHNAVKCKEDIDTANQNCLSIFEPQKRQGREKKGGIRNRDEHIPSKYRQWKTFL